MFFQSLIDTLLSSLLPLLVQIILGLLGVSGTTT